MISLRMVEARGNREIAIILPDFGDVCPVKSFVEVKRILDPFWTRILLYAYKYRKIIL